ncbi:MAG: ankyrin repeat domain-containing protein, partial [Bdellovibrionales bacterium]
MEKPEIDVKTNKENCRLLAGWLRMGHFNPDIVADLLPRISDLNIQDEDGITPLIAAVLLRDADAVNMILDAPVAKPADINFITFEAADEDDQELIPIRLNDEAEEVQVTLPTDVKLISYALKYAIEDGCKEMVELLIKRGAKVNLPDVDIIQPLNAALRCGHPYSSEIFEILCKNGADIFFTDRQEHVKAVTNCFRTFASFPSGQFIGAFSDRKEWLRHKLKTMMEFSNLDLNAKGSVILEPV